VGNFDACAAFKLTDVWSNEGVLNPELSTAVAMEVGEADPHYLPMDPKWEKLARSKLKNLKSSSAGKVSDLFSIR
jgi:hypothetical protein